jgi:hypothetical protein
MGIAFYVKDYDCKCRWSYIGFHNFRKKVAASLCLTLELTPDFKWIEQDWNKWDEDWLLFLTHSDCDGYFTPDQCGRISKKMKKVIENWMPIDIIGQYDLEHARYLIKAMEHCKENNKRMYVS